MPLEDIVPARIEGKRPVFLNVAPTDLVIENAYQRELSHRSIRLIEKIVRNFSWTKFKPPICVEHVGKYFCIDGQHSAIAAASHPHIESIPIMIVDAQSVEARASSFVAHNRDRVNMSQYQIFHGEVAAQDPTALCIQRAIEGAGGRVPRHPPARGRWRPGDCSAVNELRKTLAEHGEGKLKEIVSLAVKARCTPISVTILSAIRAMLTDPDYVGTVSNENIVTALMLRPDFDVAASRLAAQKEIRAKQAGIVLLYQAASALEERGDE